MGLKAKKALSRTELDLIVDLHQTQSGLAQVISDAQTELSAAQAVYDAAMREVDAKYGADLITARSKYGTVVNKAQLEIQTIEEQIRAIRKIELE